MEIPDSVNEVLMRDNIRRALSDAEEQVSDMEQLCLLWVRKDGRVAYRWSGGDGFQMAGLMDFAKWKVLNHLRGDG